MKKLLKIKDSIRCGFDSHKWGISDDNMENICERCGIRFADYAKRQNQEFWFRFLASLRRIKINNETGIRLVWFIAGIGWGLILMILWEWLEW